jgi:lipopolysaccharide export system ATP-binding protein
MKLEARKIEKSYSSRKVVKGVDLELKQGEIVGLLGPNGAGKTTCFYMIVGLIKCDNGIISINNNDISLEPMYKRAKQGIGYLAQEASVFRKLTVEENIKAVLELTNKTKFEQKNDLENLIKEFSLEKVRKNRGDLLSGGERRRTEIARALATEPKFLLLDEPFAGVDPIAVEEIQKIIAHLKTKNIGVLITDHNVQETLAITDRTYLMFEGKILKSGKPEELAKDEMVRKVYLGQNFIYRRKNLTFNSID